MPRKGNAEFRKLRTVFQQLSLDISDVQHRLSKSELIDYAEDVESSTVGTFTTHYFYIFFFR